MGSTSNDMLNFLPIGSRLNGLKEQHQGKFSPAFISVNGSEFTAVSVNLVITSSVVETLGPIDFMWAIKELRAILEKINNLAQMVAGYTQEEVIANAIIKFLDNALTSILIIPILDSEEIYIALKFNDDIVLPYKAKYPAKLRMLMPPSA
jgi:hypothetical protein